MSFSPSPMTTMPSIVTVPSTARIAATAAPSAPFLSPRPTQRDAASAADSVTRTSSIARLRSGRREDVGMAAAYWPARRRREPDRPAPAVASRLVLEWNPNDPDTVKVHYDVSGWSVDQRAELAEALAEADLAHVWEGVEVIVPEELEADADALFERMEAALGPFAIGLDDDDPGVEFGLDEWPPADRQTLAQALVESEMPHRWDGSTVVAATDAEATVDELLDGIEQGTLVLASGAGAAAPEGALDTLFSASDRLARDADDRAGARRPARPRRSARPGRAAVRRRRRRRGPRPSTRHASSATSSTTMRRRRATSSALLRSYAPSCGSTWRSPVRRRMSERITGVGQGRSRVRRRLLGLLAVPIMIAQCAPPTVLAGAGAAADETTVHDRRRRRHGAARRLTDTITTATAPPALAPYAFLASDGGAGTPAGARAENPIRYQIDVTLAAVGRRSGRRSIAALTHGGGGDRAHVRVRRRTPARRCSRPSRSSIGLKDFGGGTLGQGGGRFNVVVRDGQRVGLRRRRP